LDEEIEFFKKNDHLLIVAILWSLIWTNNQHWSAKNIKNSVTKPSKLSDYVVYLMYAEFKKTKTGKSMKSLKKTQF